MTKESDILSEVDSVLNLYLIVFHCNFNVIFEAQRDVSESEGHHH